MVRARGESDAVVRRTRYTLRTLVLLIASASALAAALVLGSRWSARFDLTATREHTLSPRTVGILRALDEPTAVVVSADVSKVDPRSWERVNDMLREFERLGPNARVSVIDSGRPDAPERAAAVVGALAGRDRETVERHALALQRIEAGLERAAPEFARFAGALSDRAPAAPDNTQREKQLQAAAALRVAAKDAGDAAAAVRAARESGPEVTLPDGPTLRLPETDAAARSAAPVIGAALKVLNDDAGAGLAGVLGAALPALRDTLAVLGDELKGLRPVDALAVYRALRERPVVLVYNSRGTTSVDFDTLFPGTSGTGTAGAARATPVFVGEELLGTALVSLRVDQRPVLVLVHAERERLLDETGRPAPAAANAIGRLIDRLSLRRVDIAEWAVAVDPARPPLARLDPTNQRPKVWFVMPAPARTSADPRRGNMMADRTERIGRLGAALSALLEAGDHVLLALEPSELPAVGEPDPLCEPLKSWGIRPDTARPLMERLGTPRGPAVSVYQTLRSPESGTPIGDALRGLAVMLHWPMAVEIESVPGVRAAAVFTVGRGSDAGDAEKSGAASTGDVWGESSWLALRYANVRQPFQALMPPELPGPDAGRDRLGGPFAVVVSAERDRPGGLPPQRVLVVSAPGWFEDLYTQASATVDGRRVWAFPGNGELFEAGLHWLAGMDELIAGSPRIRDVPRIEPMSEGRLSALRWTLIAGFPLAVLALGFAVRVLRG